jgi:hypothetical protein
MPLTGRFFAGFADCENCLVCTDLGAVVRASSGLISRLVGALMGRYLDRDSLAAASNSEGVRVCTSYAAGNSEIWVVLFALR